MRKLVISIAATFAAAGVASSAQAAEAPAPAKPAAVSVVQTAKGQAFADAKGKALYTYRLDDQAGGGTSQCVDACATAWPPLTASEADKPVGDWSIIKRPEGSLQWAYEGKPVYTFQGDQKAGDIAGDGLQRSWALARYIPPLPDIRAPVGVTLVRKDDKVLMTDFKGMTIYHQVAANPGATACTGSCLATWRPLEAPALAAPVGDWTIIARPDGLKQWAFKGRALYRFDGESKPAQTDGENEPGWKAAQP